MAKTTIKTGNSFSKQGGNMPSTTGNKSGKGRGNNPPNTGGNIFKDKKIIV